MDSRLNVRLLALVTAAVAIAGACFFLSYGLYPRWWPVWLAALPLLWLAPRLSWAAAAGAALAARFIGGLSMWNYYGQLQFPLWLKVLAPLLPAIAVAAGVLAFRAFFRRGQVWLAAVSFPIVMVAYEYLFNLWQGSFGSTAYTQLHNLPVLQLGALAGLWGTGFVVMLFPSMVAAIALRGADAQGKACALTLVIVLGGTFGYGLLRLRNTPAAPHSVAVGLVVSDLPRNTRPQDDSEVMRLMREYAEQVKLLSARGAKIVVLPEMTALVHDSNLRDVDALFQETARAANVQIDLGVLHVTPKGTYNEARLYSESGTLAAVYRKHHLVPVVEGEATPGNDISVVPEPAGTIGLEICRDMDYPNPARRYGEAQVGLVLAPAWDFDVDRYWHGHMSILRGVENGFSLVRAAKRSLLTVSDDRGRILCERRTSPEEPFNTLVATVPVRHDWTLYQSWGDWFAWLDLAALAGVVAALVAGRPH